MSDDATRTLTPTLRFPEFREPWQEKSLEKLGSLISGLTYSPEDVRDDGLLVLRSSNIQDGQIALEDKVFVRRDIPGANRSEPNDILICVRNGSKSLIGKTALIPEGMPPCTHGAFMTIFRSPSAHFTFHLFQTATYQEQVAADLGATINSINGGQLKRYRFLVPEPAEQQKIADCLTSLDRLIAAQGQKVAALKSHKKGLMQQLFPGDGETLPRLRFPEFRNTGRWHLKKIRSMLEETPRPIEINDDEEYSLVTVKRRFGGVVSRERLTGRAIKVKSQFIVNTNDFLISKRQVVHDACGLVPPNLDGSIVSNEYAVLGPKNGCDIVFFNYFAQQPAVSASFRQSSDGIVIEKMLFKLNRWLNLKFRFPSISEQQRIAACLGSLDARVTYETEKLIAIKTHKKGLMQQLFPSVEGN
jgi:type I restriction enzyme S subunit